LFLEEPVKVGSVEALLAVSRRSPVPIAAGEKLFTLRAFKELVDARACAYLQPDVAHCFGISNMTAIARLAETSQMLMAPHNAGGPLHLAATLHVDAAVSNFLIQEVPADWFDQFHRYVDHDWVIKDGYVNVSDRPGLGVEVKEQDIARLPYEPMDYRQYRHEDGSWKGW
jgi:galactonate dehydratase